jgi:hypothetical protein
MKPEDRRSAPRTFHDASGRFQHAEDVETLDVF